MRYLTLSILTYTKSGKNNCSISLNINMSVHRCIAHKNKYIKKDEYFFQLHIKKPGRSEAMLRILVYAISKRAKLLGILI